MTTLDASIHETLTAALQAYRHDYGGESLVELRAIAGALLAVKVQAGDLTLQGWEAEPWVDALVADIDLGQLPQGWQATDRELATQARHWREQLAVKTQATIDAYLQKYIPTDSPDVRQLVATALPILSEVTIPRDTAQHLIDAVSHQLELPTARDRTIDPKWWLLAEQVHQVWQHREIENSVADVMQAYVHKFQPAAVDIGESLVEQAVEAVSNSRLKLGLNVDLTPETRQLLIKQVMLKVKLRNAAAPPTKTALEIALDLHDEVLRYRRDRGLDTSDYWPPTIIEETNDDSSVLGGEMSIGIDRHRHSGAEPATFRQAPE